MFRIFYKTIIHLFLWVILMANLMMFFDMTSPITVIGGMPSSFEGKYFGVTALIEAFKYLPNSNIGRTTQKLNDTLNLYSGLMSKVFNYGWSRIPLAWNYVAEGKGIDRVIGFVSFIASFLAGIGSVIGSLIMGLALPLLFFAWLLFALLSLVEFIWRLTGGQFATALPPSQLLSAFVSTPLLDFAVWGV